MLRVGVIYPGDSGADSEMWRLTDWFCRHGLGGVEAVVERSQSDGSHKVDSLFETGRQETLLAPARRLARQRSDVILWACTSGSFIGGASWAQAQADALGAAADRPATSTSLALVAAIQAIRARRVDLLSPYPDAATRALVSFFEEFGIHPEPIAILGCADGQSSRRLNLRVVVREAVGRSSEPGSPILVPDTAIDTLDLIPSLEEDTGRIVITANQATVWHGLRLIGIDDALRGAGTLFEVARSP